MSLFQPSILSKHINALDKTLVGKQWEIFKAHFHNPVIQENIRQSKEEQYQEGFLRDLFVSVFGYTLNPSAGYNLTTEYKNVKDSKKADGAILSLTRGHAEAHSTRGHAPLLNTPADSYSVRAIIELKGNDTTDLDKIEPQAFGYKNNQPECKYIIISNFEKLRFYIENTVDYLEFNLFTLTETEFQTMWLCLACKNIMNDIPALIKNASVSKEEDITKQLYKDYSLFKRELYQNMVKLNPQHDELELFQKSQKLLDRILFLLFGEDRYLLPPNAVRKILEQWEMLKDNDAYFPLYERFKMYFGYLNIGKQGKQHDIFAYNGGLFKPDDLLDNVNIDDQLLYSHTLKLSAYNFQSDVDVNILGHIFENSLNEIDEIKAQLEGKEIDKAQTKRKKDGVYYTPKYITKYIVENTVGRLCADKKAELGIVEEEYTVDKKRNVNAKKTLIERLTEYRNWLLQITIVDPACGSGAFLNQALVFLMDEHQYIDELEAKVTGSSFVFSNIENSILENNLFGVDLNEESVEIAKLSLWLRTARPNRKLNDLNSNIKCGNSLIDDPAVAGDKAFNWQKEFPQVFTLKNKKIWHVTTATHNSRYSQRMFDCHIAVEEAEWIDTEDELIITQAIAEIANDGLNIVEYNLCGDHMHLLLVCETEELPAIVGKIKSITAKKRNLARGYTTSSTTGTRGHAPLSSSPVTLPSSASLPASDTLSSPSASRGETQHSLWTQKFGKTEITSEEHLRNTIEYIRNNRTKHGLPDINKGLQPLVDRMRCTLKHALRPEYKGGFDVVIGNPPYVRAELLPSTHTTFYQNNYKVFGGTADLFSYFYELGLNILKSKGLFGFISNTFDKTTAGATLREYISSSKKIIKYLDFTEVQIFAGATTYPVILILSKDFDPNIVFDYQKVPKSMQGAVILETLPVTEVHQSDLNSAAWAFNNIGMSNILSKISQHKTVKEQYGKCYRGILTGFNEAFIIDEKTKNELIAASPTATEVIKPLYEGKDLTKWTNRKIEKYLLALYPSKNFDIDNYASVKDYLLTFGLERLEQTGGENSRKKTNNKWFETQDTIGYWQQIEKTKIVWPNLQNNNKFSFDKNNYAINAPACLLPTEDVVLLSILNSKLIWKFLLSICVVRSGGYIEVKPQYFEQIPIPPISETEREELFHITDKMLSLNKELQEVSGKFVRNMQREFGLQSLSGKLQSWHDLSYADFLRELAKAKVSLSLSQKAEWETYFTTEQQNAQNLKQQISATDNEIDCMVYELYGLTDEEIRIVEGE